MAVPKSKVSKQRRSLLTISSLYQRWKPGRQSPGQYFTHYKVVYQICQKKDNIRTGMTAADQDVAGMLQRSKKPVVLAVNKMDSTGHTGGPQDGELLHPVIHLGLLAHTRRVNDESSKKPVVLAVNKMDSTGHTDPDMYEFYNLGLGDPYSVSAVHGAVSMMRYFCPSFSR